MLLNSAFISLFLSTPSARRATYMGIPTKVSKGISIHALREEGDPTYWKMPSALLISIHALREEGDQETCKVPHLGKNFYPRPPRGGRQAKAAQCDTTPEFLSTPSARRATLCIPCACWLCPNFYPRPPRGGRPHPEPSGRNQNYFYPRPPRGGRHRSAAHLGARCQFLSTPSARRATSRQVRP